MSTTSINTNKSLMAYLNEIGSGSRKAGAAFKEFLDDNPKIKTVTTILTIASFAIGIAGLALGGCGVLPNVALICLNLTGTAIGIVSTAITVKGLYDSNFLKNYLLPHLEGKGKAKAQHALQAPLPKIEEIELSVMKPQGDEN